VGVVTYLIDESGTKLRDFPDPIGGRFDSAGDFDRLLTVLDPALTLWPTLDPYADSVLGSDRMSELLADLNRVAEHARYEIERRGLNRLRVLAERCANDPSLSLLFEGD
jgi:hypothetical protein